MNLLIFVVIKNLWNKTNKVAFKNIFIKINHKKNSIKEDLLEISEKKQKLMKKLFDMKLNNSFKKNT